ncbi:MAG: PEGA domain-containing protein [Burkholderiales bacterium]|nr:PEGA domain-containing protein [Burkholderiales bacterium]
MSTHGNRTFICTVAFIDIIEYSKKSVAEQMQVKEQLNALLAQALADVPNKDRIILDTGDGAAISFLGDPEDGLFLGLALRDALAARNDDSLRLRTGINLGPVRLVKDINGQPNIIGDGINVSQRVMSFADVNRVLASRSYYEVISALSPDYAHLFRFEGARTDKHVREHEVYALGNEPAPQRSPRRKPGPAAAHATAALEKLSRAANTARLQIMQRPPLATALAVILILGVAITLRLAQRGVATDAGLETHPETAIAAPDAPAPVPPSLPPPTAKKPAAAPAVNAKPEPPPSKTTIAKKPPQAAAVADAAPATTGTVRLSILPWGEIHVDGTKFGVAPPLRDIALKPGIHKIEVRNPGFASYLQVVEIRAGEEIRIQHRFR